MSFEDNSSTVLNDAIDFGECDVTTGIAHCDSRQEGVRRQARYDVTLSCLQWEVRDLYRTFVCGGHFRSIRDGHMDGRCRLADILNWGCSGKEVACGSRVQYCPPVAILLGEIDFM